MTATTPPEPANRPPQQRSELDRAESEWASSFGSLQSASGPMAWKGRVCHTMLLLVEELALPDIRQNVARHRYEFDTEAGAALAFYRLHDGVMTLTHTE